MDYLKEIDTMLKNYANLKDSIISITDEVQMLDEEIQDLKAIQYSDMPKSVAFNVDDRLINLIYKKDIKEKSLKATQNKVKHIDMILLRMNNHYPFETSILKAIYIEKAKGYNLERICGITERQVYRVKKKALKLFAIQLYGIEVIEETWQAKDGQENKKNI